MVRLSLLLISFVILRSSTYVWGQDILCPFFNNLQPDTSSNAAIVEEVVQRGNVGRVTANFLVYSVFMLQQGPLGLLRGDVLDLQRLDEVLIVSHPDLYTAEIDGVEERLLELADEQGLITIDELFDVKQWVADVTGVNRISTITRSETIALFLSAGGNLDDETIPADNVLRFLRNDWDVQDNGAVTAARVTRGFFIATF